ncbi:MAG TPA: hypothetical protein PLO40_12935 [Spirochaetota bacterium]|nr:hypothetical protein [Spirochaetota bacterium]HQF79100.1 hypothetical protein [Spirochaetota bacterium]
MALSENEKQKVIDKLEVMDDVARGIIVSSLDALAKWLSNVLYDIYVKIKNALKQFWEWLKAIFG